MLDVWKAYKEGGQRGVEGMGFLSGLAILEGKMTDFLDMKNLEKRRILYESGREK